MKNAVYYWQDPGEWCLLCLSAQPETLARYYSTGNTMMAWTDETGELHTMKGAENRRLDVGYLSKLDLQPRGVYVIPNLATDPIRRVAIGTTWADAEDIAGALSTANRLAYVWTNDKGEVKLITPA